MQRSKMLKLGTALVFTAAAFAGPVQAAEPYPSRPVRIIVP